MTDEYLEAFVREGEEHVTELNNALLDLEDDPSDEAAMDDIFRIAHTLKGNFAAMGFSDASDLAHALEDLLDEMRGGTIDVTPDRMDHVFAAVDEIEACLDEIEADGDTSRDVTPVIEDVRATMDEGATADAGDEQPASAPDEGGESAAPSSDAGSGPGDAGVIDDLSNVDRDALAAVDDRLFVVRVEMGDSDMKAVDAAFVLEAADDAFEVVDADPDRDAIDAGEYDDGFDLVVAGDVADVESTFTGVQQVADATATEITDAVGAGATGEASESGQDAATDAGEADAAASTEADAGEAGEADTGDADAVDVAGGDSVPKRSAPDTGDASGGDDDTDGDGGDDSSGGGGPSSSSEIQSVRVDVSQLDDLHGLVEQLVTTRIKLRRSVDEDDRRAEEELDELDKITSSLQDTVMDMRLVPLRKIAGKFPRLVRDLAREEDKDVDFVMEGEDVEIDRTILTEISDPLMHLLRNAIDHGVEPPEEREAAGKDPTATVTLRAQRDRDRVVIEVIDDGSGIDLDRVREKAIETGIKTANQIENMEDDEIADLVFHPGFSTNEEVTDVSGRGVGMDVVRDTVSRLDGSVSIDTEPGEGTTFRLSLPVTVAIVKVLFVSSGEEEYGIPIKTVDEISRMREIKQVDGEEVITYDGEVYPLVRLGEALDVPGPTKNGDGMLVRIRSAERQVALHCDQVRGQEEVVVKPFEGILSGIPGLSGAAVLGEGDVVTILDVATL